MSISIPEPKRQKNVAVNQHMIPRCYMKNWGYNAKRLQYGFMIKKIDIMRKIRLDNWV